MTPVVQALVAIAIVLFVWFVIIPMCFKNSAVVAGDKVKLSVPIIEGKIIMNNSPVTIDTSDPSQVEYLSLPPSNNLKGGIQYSYSMWMNKAGLTSAVANRMLFMRGLKTTSKVVTLNNDIEQSGGIWKIGDNATDTYNAATSLSTEPLVKQPLVKFGSDENELKIQFNTLKNPSNEIVITGDMMTLLNTNAWYLLTFTFQDGYGIDGFENGVMVKFFINDKEMMTKTIPHDALVLNQDPIYILPNLSTTDVDTYSTISGAMADFTYHNYALSQNEMLALVIKGFINAPFVTPGSKKTSDNARKYYNMSLNNALQNL